MENCGLGVLNMSAYTDKTAFDNSGHDINTAGAAGRTGKE